MAPHHHHHDHHAPATFAQGNQSNQIRLYIFCILLNLLFVGVEAGVGFWQDSLSLLSDAGHNLSDVFSLVLVLIAFQLARVHPHGHYTYGLKKSTILISLLNAILLLVAVGGIVVESIHKFNTPVEVNGTAISWTAGIGILINGLTALLLLRGSQADLNQKGAYLHMVADTLVSVGVVFSGILINLTGWNIVDPIVSLIIAVVILGSTWSLLTDSLRLIIDGTPEGVEPEAIEQIMTAIDGVSSIHHLHIWAISTTDNALTAHVVVNELDRMEQIKDLLKQQLHAAGIAHATLEFETAGSHCHDHECQNETC